VYVPDALPLPPTKSSTHIYILTCYHTVQGALTWLEENQDKSLDELQAQASKPEAAAEDDEDDEGAPKIPAVDGENAKSLVCNECGKRFKNEALASYHASKTEHTDFSESTEEIAPLTEEQKAAKLEELRARLAAKRAAQAEKDKEEAKRNAVGLSRALAYDV
jgi:hypothetical protein